MNSEVKKSDRPSRLFGGELERVVISRDTGCPIQLSPQFFDRLRRLGEARGSFVAMSEGLGVITKDLGEQGIDCGFHVQETALPPCDSLTELANRALSDVQGVISCAREEEKTFLNFSTHPLGRRDLLTYQKFVAPKPIYSYLWYRGWDHTAGFNGAVQTSPSTSVSIYEAAEAASAVIGAGAAFIALCANSPFEEGKMSGKKESRLGIWERMFASSKHSGDRVVSKFPPNRFNRLSEYFNWMFGPGTAIHYISRHSCSYKEASDRWLVEGGPSLLHFFSRTQWNAMEMSCLQTGDFKPQVMPVYPSLHHLEEHQWAQFSGARIRFTLKKCAVEPRQFYEVCVSDGSLEDLLESCVESMWIEGRDPGANYLDRELAEAGLSSEMCMAPMALQGGILNNLRDVTTYLNRYPWSQLEALRDAAIREGLHGEVEGVRVSTFAAELLEIARDGVAEEERYLLYYFDYVLRTGKNGADRAIDALNASSLPFDEALLRLIKEREALC